MHFMQEQGFDVTMISSDGPEVKEITQREQCKHIAVELTRKISPWKDLLSLIKLVMLFRKLRPAIVHTHTPKAGLIGMCAAKIAGVPVRLHTIAGLPWMEKEGVLRKLLVLIEKITAYCAVQIYPNSWALQKYLTQQNIATGKMKVLGNGSSNGIDCDFFSATPDIAKIAGQLLLEEEVSPDAWVWVFVGRIVKDKGIGELLDAFTAIQQVFPNDRLWLVGAEEPELDPLLPHHTAMLKENHGIRCWGFQKDVRPFLASAKVLTFPSYREGFPNVPMQAGAMGCALILSDINGCNEIVENESEGLLVQTKSVAQLSAAMFDLRNNPEKRDKLAAVIRNKIKAGYDQKMIWNSILNEYSYWLKQTKTASLVQENS